LIQDVQAEDENHDSSSSVGDDEEEHIVVTRPEDERDPEAEAEFDREFAKMMAESLDSRKFERKPIFDVPLPMRRVKEAEEAPVAAAAPVGPGTMKFSLLSKKGNRQQVSDQIH
jgi:regulator of nonsense transcripts 2